MLLKNLYDRLPDSIHQIVDNQRFRLGMPTMFGSMYNLKRNGFAPGLVIDAGAYEGKWTRGIKAVYPSTPVLMVEANPEKEARLAALQKELGPSVAFERTLLGACAREAVTFYSMETGSSVMPEVTSVPRQAIALEMKTLDEVAAKADVVAPLLIKLDVQGYELEVLRGATRTLKSAEVLVMELSLLEYNLGAPLIGQVQAAVGALGFVMYDICGQHRRQKSRALLQVDAIFVRQSSRLRTGDNF